MNAMRCHSCGKELKKGGLKYVVEIKSFADFDEYLEEYPGSVEDGIDELLDAMENVDTKNLEDDVYRERTYVLCKSCRDRFSDNPFHAGSPMIEEERDKGTLH